MIVLGIETSTEVCAVGLANDDGAYAERALVESHIHSEKLLTLIAEMLGQQHATLSALDAIAVSIGPGSFTGLRIGLSTAKGLCIALEKPLVIVPTLEAMAMAAFADHQDVKRVYVCLDAKQGDCYAGGYERAEKKVVEYLPLSMIKKASADELLNQKNALMITDRKDIQHIRPNAVHYAKGSSIAWSGIMRAHKKIFSDITSVEPMYLKDFVVKTQPVR
ncbi:MAG TPA: tRNA (adenosine(37)-N6)-threonylcarbamoyltransferase complex dimerization subunit type 1 TsaB [Bacteroidota bacterium]|nr:tRNA (adenosine(37)-N6)-threonylcarbamoyltransferase complex dimerization subunit type 1 TsaB [Bacteroidota bacterium]